MNLPIRAMSPVGSAIFATVAVFPITINVTISKYLQNYCEIFRERLRVFSRSELINIMLYFFH